MSEIESEVPETSVEGTESQVSESSSEQPAQPSMVELDSLEKFKYSGREMTPKELQGMIMMQSDYTKKTQEIAQERKYYDNLNADLAAVKKDPTLADKFKSVYPEKFHAYLDYLTPAQQAQAVAQQQQGMDPAFMREFNQMKSEMRERNVAAIEAQLDATFKGLSAKYPFADEEAAIARGQALLERGEQLTDKVWESIWKSVNQRNEELAKKHYSTMVNKQKSANAQGKDGASGGGIPGQAPRQPKTLKEASDFARDALGVTY